MRFRQLLTGGLLVVLFALAGCSVTATSPSSKSPSPASGGPSATSGPVVFALATQLIRSAPVEQIEAVRGGSPLWTRTLPTAGSALSVHSGTLYVGDGDTVLALDAANGQKKWSVPVSSRVTALSVEGNLLIVGTGLGGSTGQQALAILNAADGSQRWSLTSALGVSGWLIEGKTLFAVETGFPPQLVADDVMTGTTKWHVPLQSGVVSGAITAFLPADSASLLLVSDQSIAAISQDNGALVWLHQNSHNLGITIQGGVAYSFYVDMAAAFGGNPTVGLRGVNVSDDSVVWNQKLASDNSAYLSFQKALTIGAITSDAAYLIDGPGFGQTQAWNLSGQTLWSVSSAAPYAALAVDALSVYLTSSQGITALSTTTGKQSWRVPGPTDLASLQVENGTLFAVNTGNKTLYLLNASTGQLSWKFSTYQLHLYAVAS